MKLRLLELVFAPFGTAMTLAFFLYLDGLGERGWGFTIFKLVVAGCFLISIPIGSYVWGMGAKSFFYVILRISIFLLLSFAIFLMLF